MSIAIREAGVETDPDVDDLGAAVVLVELPELVPTAAAACAAVTMETYFRYWPSSAMWHVDASAKDHVIAAVPVPLQVLVVYVLLENVEADPVNFSASSVPSSSSYIQTSRAIFTCGPSEWLARVHEASVN